MAIQNDGEEPTVPHVPLAAIPHFFTSGNQAQHVWRLWFNDPRHRALAAGLGVLLLVGTVVTVGLLHIAASRPDSYLFTSHTEVAFIQFTADQSGHLSGSLQDVSPTSDETIQGADDAFTGVQNGSQISLTFSALGFSATMTGTLSGDTLTLHVPDQNGYVATEMYHAASVSDYNNAAAQLRQRTVDFAAATQAAQATATTQAALDQAVTNANNQVSSDLSTLNADMQSLAGSSDFSSVLNSYAKDWAQMQKDYQQEQTDYQGGCQNYATVGVDADTVDVDLNSINVDDNSFQITENPLQTAITQVQSDITTVQSDWSTLQAAVAADKTGSVTAQFSAGDINSATASAQTQIDDSNKALQSAQARATQYDKEAAQTNTDAQNLANSMHC